MNCDNCGLVIEGALYVNGLGQHFHESDAVCFELLKAEVATLRQQTTPRRYSEQNHPQMGEGYLYWDSNFHKWFKAYWPERRFPEVDEVWLPMPPAPEVHP